MMSRVGGIYGKEALFDVMEVFYVLISGVIGRVYAFSKLDKLYSNMSIFYIKFEKVDLINKISI